MKYSDYLLMPGSRTLATFFGVLAGGLTAIFLGWQVGVLVGASGAILLSFLLPFLAYREDIPYNKIKETLAQPFLFDERVRFTLAQGSVGGYFILTNASLILLSLENGSHRLELKREDVRRIEVDQRRALRIYLNDTKFVQVLSAYSQEMFDVLSENGWT